MSTNISDTVLYIAFALLSLCGLTVERSLAILKVAGSKSRISAGPLLGNSLGQAAHTHVPLSVTKQYNLVPADGQ